MPQTFADVARRGRERLGETGGEIEAAARSAYRFDPGRLNRGVFGIGNKGGKRPVVAQPATRMSEKMRCRGVMISRATIVFSSTARWISDS